jgi:hypothetical protein
MEREGVELSLHKRLTRALVRGAQAQEDSRAIIDAHHAVDARVQTTLARVRSAREQRARRREVRIRTGHERDRSASG